ncbi:MAG TPA: carboxypeptidase regulatory-like domain-containing protein, partial [bacterium]|nr:carboxypeptidase regulatory-like domain-containing protein [bacterium]
EESIRGQEEEVKLGAGLFSLTYAANPYVEFALRGTVEHQAVSPVTGSGESQAGFGMASAAIKTLLTPRSQSTWLLAAEIEVGSATGDPNALVGTWDHDGFDIGARVDFTYIQHREKQSASPRVHLNAGYLERTGEFDQEAWEASIAGGTPSRLVLHGDQVLYGAALEIPVPSRVTFFTEWSGEYDLDSGARFEDNPMRITPGLRWSTPSGAISASLGYELSLAKDQGGPPQQLAFGLTITGAIAPGSGTISGIVRDAETGNPISNATIRVRDENRDPAITGTDGKYRTDLEEGYVVVDLNAEGYATKTRVLEIKRNDNLAMDFLLTRRNPFGVVRGRVQDQESGGPVTMAQVRVLGQETWTACDSLSGTYRLENVPEGNVVLEYEARGYARLTQEVIVTAAHETLHEATLERTTDYYVGKITGTIRDAISGAPLVATIQIAGNEEKTIPLDATGSFDLQLKGGKYPVTIKSEGHLSKTETIEIKERTTQARDIELKPIPSALALQGALFDEGSATIKRESRKSLDEAGKFLLENNDVKVVIRGHSDGSGASDSVQELAQKRADAVMKYLVVNYGISPNRLRAVANAGATNKPGRVDLVIEAGARN